MAREPFDVIVIGGGHNGLVAAGLLARRGARVTVLERREQVGGAAITEQPWGPDFKMTALSYVVSLMPPTILRELQLERHGYRILPQGPYFAPRPDGPALRIPDDPRARHEAISRFSPRDADAYPEWESWLAGLADVLGPLLTETPPRLGSHRPADLLAQGRFAWTARRWDQRSIADITRLFTMSIADLVEERFESDAMRGVLSVSGVIGTWAGPRSAGTAYVMAHHKVGDVGDGQLGAWGFPEGGMGSVTRALRDAALSFGATVRTNAEVMRIIVRDGAAVGVVTTSGEEIFADVVIAATHPQITFLHQLEATELPDDFVEDIRRWKTRSGTVKVNLALDRLPEFTSAPGFDPDVHGGTIVLAPSLDHVEQAFQDAVAGRPATAPFADICIPSVFDRTLAPEGKHVMSLFTQWVPASWADEPHRDELNAYGARLIEQVEAVAPGFTDSILHSQIIGPYDMEHTYGLIGGNIFHGELSPAQLFHMRPAPGYADYRTPIRGLYQASSATHGGGGVTGIPGLKVVEQITHDRATARDRVRRVFGKPS
ncbi:MAG: NAD(P)/FAD-dependent oxidoreductase [Acidimicrobiia bacterium]|nr:NAD(P)/FAD-dependent oxidoreductase [Acidimicrobiia bacterium]